MEDTAKAPEEGGSTLKKDFQLGVTLVRFPVQYVAQVEHVPAKKHLEFKLPTYLVKLCLTANCYGYPPVHSSILE